MILRTETVVYQPDENKTLLKSSMLQCLFSHICRKLRIAGIYISEVISSYLCSDPLPVRIYIYCRIRRFKPFNIIAKRNSLGCDSSVTAKRKSQYEYACKSKQPVGTLGKSQNQVVFFLRNVQNMFRKMQRLFFVAVLILN